MKIVKLGDYKWQVGIVFHTGEDDIEYKDYDKNRICFYLYWVSFMIVFKHQWILPYKHNNSYKGALHTTLLDRKFGFSYSWPDGIHYSAIYHGVDGERSHGEVESSEWTCTIPWLDTTHTHTYLLRKSGIFLKDITRMDYENYISYVHGELFDVIDYDGTIVQAFCYKKEMRWDHGTGWFKWLKYFRKPILRYCMEIEFSEGVTSRKETWKGGILGHSINLEYITEPMERAMKRYCKENGLTYLGYTKNDKRIEYIMNREKQFPKKDEV